MLNISAIPDKLRMLCIQMLYKKMKYETSEQFEFLDFHDSIIDGTTISDDVISIEIEFANILPEHSENPYRTAKNIEPCRLQFVGVVRREVALYKENKINLFAHPDPNNPITEEILEASEKVLPNNLREYKICGMYEHGWSEWSITCSRFSLTWGEFNGDAWFVNWPSKKSV